MGLGSIISAINAGAAALNLGVSIAGVVNPEKNKPEKEAQKEAALQAQFTTKAQEEALRLALESADPERARYQALIEESRQAYYDVGQRRRGEDQRVRGREIARGVLPSFASGIPNRNRQDEYAQSFDYRRDIEAQERNRENARNTLRAASGLANIGLPSAANTAGQLAGANELRRKDQFAADLGGIGTSTRQLERSWEDLFGTSGPTGTLTTFGGSNAPPGGIGRPAGRNDPS